VRAGTQDVLMGGALVALGLPWAATTLIWLGTPLLLPSDLFQFAVFALVFSRTLLYLGIPRLRKLSWGASVVLFSGDFLILPAAAAVSVVTGNQSQLALASSYIASWFSASLLVYPPVAAYVIANAFRAKARLAFVLPAAACSFTVSALVLVAIESTAVPQGFTGVLGMALAEIRHSILPPEWALGAITCCGAILFVSLAAYAVIGRSDANGKLAPKLSLGVAGAFALLVWILAMPHVGPVLTLGAPTLVIVLVIWVASRES